MPKRAASPVKVAAAAGSAWHCAFLRAINVGGTGHISQDDLRSMATRAGGRDVRSYIQSGNLVFRLDAEMPVSEFVAKFEKSLGSTAVKTSVCVRSQSELANVILAVAALEEKHGKGVEKSGAKAQGVFLFHASTSEQPSAEWVAQLAAAQGVCARASDSDFGLWLPNGVGQTKAMQPAAMNRGFGGPCTVRNLNTLRAMAGMMVAGSSDR